MSPLSVRNDHLTLLSTSPRYTMWWILPPMFGPYSRNEREMTRKMAEPQFLVLIRIGLYVWVSLSLPFLTHKNSFISSWVASMASTSQCVCAWGKFSWSRVGLL